MLTRPFHLALAAAMAFSIAAPSVARAQLPHERLHNLLFGGRDRDDDRDRDKKRKKYKYDRDDDRRYREHRCYDHSHNGYCDVCGTRIAVIRRQPVIRVVPQVRYESYDSYDRYDRRPIEVDVQVALRRAGYYRGPIDGDIGAGSRSAIRNYQYDRGLPVTGRIDAYLLDSLGLR